MWKTVKLSEICEIQPPKKEVKNILEDDSKVSFMGMDLLGIDNMHANPEEVRSLSSVYKGYTYFAENDVLLAKITPCFENGKLGVARGLKNGVGFGSSEFVVFRCKENILPNFLYYFLNQKSFREEGKKNMSGAVGHKRVTKEFIANSLISLPPLAEQQRIVAKLDAAFAEIDGAIKAVEKKIENITFVFSQILDGLVNASDLGKEVLLGDVCKLSQGLAINKSTKHLLVDKSTQPLLRIKDLISNKVEQYIDDSYRNEKTRVTKEDIVFTRTGSLGLAFRGMEGVLHNNSFKVEPEISLSSDYLFWWLKHPTFLEKIHSVAAKAAQPDISHKLFSAQSMRLPTLEKQAEIVSKIEKLMPIIESLTKLYRNKLESFMSLKSAVLAQELQGEAA